MNESTARNIRVQDRYDELMRIGRHGHYETMFQVVREETESLRQQLAAAHKGLDAAIESNNDQIGQIKRLEHDLTAALAAIKVKDAFLHMVTTEIRWSGDPMYEAACEALAATEPNP
jgi:hypothetical protein